MRHLWLPVAGAVLPTLLLELSPGETSSGRGHWEYRILAIGINPPVVLNTSKCTSKEVELYFDACQHTPGGDPVQIGKKLMQLTINTYARKHYKREIV